MYRTDKGEFCRRADDIKLEEVKADEIDAVRTHVYPFVGYTDADFNDTSKDKDYFLRVKTNFPWIRQHVPMKFVTVALFRAWLVSAGMAGCV